MRESKRRSPLRPEFKAKADTSYRLSMAASAALDAGKYEEAEVSARRSVEAHCEPGLGQKFLAESLYRQDKDQEALEAYKVMVDTGSQDSKDLLPYSLLMLKGGKWVESLAAFNKVLIFLGEPIPGGKAAMVNAYGHFLSTVSQPRELATAIHLALGISYEGTYSWGGHSEDGKAMAEYHEAFLLSPDSAVAQRFEEHRMAKLKIQQERIRRSQGPSSGAM